MACESDIVLLELSEMLAVRVDLLLDPAWFDFSPEIDVRESTGCEEYAGGSCCSSAEDGSGIPLFVSTVDCRVEFWE
jgi:hypothetical protein